MKNFKYHVLIIFLMVFFTSCDDECIYLEQLTPHTKMSNTVFELTVEGRNFDENSEIIFNSTAKETTYINSEKITCMINQEDARCSNTQAEFENSPDQGSTISVSVRNKTNTSRESNKLPFFARRIYLFGEPVKLVESDYAYSSQMVIDSHGDLLSVYHIMRPLNDPGENAFYFIRSTDNGKSWSAPLKISPENTRAESVIFLIDKNDTLYAVYLILKPYSPNSNPWSYQMIKSSDGGETWSNPSVVREISDALTWAYSATLDSNGNLYYIWPEVKAIGTANTSFLITMMYRKYDGNSWSEGKSFADGYNMSLPKMVSDSSGNPTIIFFGGRHNTNEINFYLCKSLDSGESWSSPKIIREMNPVTEHIDSFVVGEYSNKAIYLLWTESNNDNTNSQSSEYLTEPGLAASSSSRTKMIYSEDGGESWSEPEDLSLGNFDSIRPEEIIIDRFRNLIVILSGAEEYNTYEDLNLWVSRSIDNGKTWSPKTNIIQNDGMVKRGGILVDGNGDLKLTIGLHERGEDNYVGWTQYFINNIDYLKKKN
jgi:hypothetical protein